MRLGKGWTMDNYTVGAAVRLLRKKRGLTQAGLAALIGVSGKAVSKWENAKGLPDISLLEPLSAALGVSVSELMTGRHIENRNVSCNLLRSAFRVCPVCGNIIYASGDAAISCCGTALTPLEAKDTDEDHRISIQQTQDEYFLSLSHDMTKAHYISFAAFVTQDRMQFVKLYPEGGCETVMPLRSAGTLYIYCIRHGLMKQAFRPGRH